MRARVAAARVAALVALVATSRVGVARAAPPATIAASRDVMDSLPRDDDDGARRRLRCNACAAACDALVRDLARERARRGGTLTRALADATMEATCARAGEELGLTMRDGRVTETFAGDDGNGARERAVDHGVRAGGVREADRWGTRRCVDGVREAGRRRGANGGEGGAVSRENGDVRERVGGARRERVGGAGSAGSRALAK